MHQSLVETDMRKSLERALQEAESPVDSPWPLPLAHLTIARWFRDIVADGRLKPCRCKVMGKRLLYLSYGGVFYRGKELQTENATELPLAFVFSPEIAYKVAEAYPFDTGAMATGRFGEEWTSAFSPFENDFRIIPKRDPRVLSNLVYHLWRSNRDYLDGTPDPSSESKPEPFPLLFRFFASDLTSLDIDHRQRTIECLATTDLQLDRALLWVGYPNILEKEFVTLCNKTRPWIPDYFAYQSHRNFNPARVAEVLEQQAALRIERFISLI